MLEVEQDLSTIRVSEKLLVVPSQAVLPAFCVKTGRRLQAKEMRSVVLEYSAPAAFDPMHDPFLAGLLAQPMSIFVGWYSPKRCQISYGLSRGPRLVWFLHVLLQYGLLLAIAVGCLAAWWYNQPSLICLLAPCGLLLLLRWVVQPTVAPLKIVRYSDGQFYIAGCGRKFLAIIVAREAALLPSSERPDSSV
jgi:hypothetical protein